MAGGMFDRGFRHMTGLLVGLVTLPTLGLLAVGVLILVLKQDASGIALGVVAVTLTSVLIIGAVLLGVLLRRQARLARMQTDFTTRVGHDLMTPLTAIRMFTESLRAGSVPEAERDRVLELLDTESARLQSRIERMLRWARMEEGAHAWAMRAEDANELIREALAAYRASVLPDEARAELPAEAGEGSGEGRESPGSAWVLADRDAVIDALVNLLLNAHKHGEGAIGITLEDEGQTLGIAVSDRGPGIAAKDHKRIFRRFERLDDRLSAAGDGTGLGLAIVDRIARAHGAPPEVRSEPGRGSTFILRLKRADPPAGDQVGGSRGPANAPGESA